MIFTTSLARLSKDNFEYPVLCFNESYWNDQGYETGFVLTKYDTYQSIKNNKGVRIGYLKIGRTGMFHDSSSYAYQSNPERTELPNSLFASLNEEFFSVGQDASYYLNIRKFFLKEEQDQLLLALRDVAYSEKAYEIARPEKVFGTSLIRQLSTHTIENEYRGIISGEEGIPSEYSLKLNIKREVNDEVMEINVFPNSFPNTNLHAIIGRNGVGKSFFFKALINGMAILSNKSSLETEDKEEEYLNDYFTSVEGTENIASVLAIDLSVFDSTLPRGSAIAVPTEGKIRYTFIGFPFTEVNPDEIPEELTTGDSVDENLNREFRNLSREILKRDTQKNLLLSTIKVLESDPMFKNNEISKWFDEYNEELRMGLFGRLSSGHKISLLMILEVILNIEINSLLLIDEPELHLHPPLLSSLIKAINTILVKKNAVCLMATHSPVVLQEITRKCAWILNREQQSIKIQRPTIETFGENINTLTREVFGLEVENSGYEKLIREVVDDSESFEAVLEKFDNQLSDSAKLLAAVLWETKEDE
ncbi:AAA family ATPase [Enterococcus entomosocium]|uniref:AAA family ATPase n=1 Tax=Enterococcus entomosocium TaxID=3034352 RepID=UPI003B5A6272